MLSSKFMSRLNASIFLATFILSLIASSCGDSTHNTVKDKIVGRWHWVQSTGGWTGETITPDSLGIYRTVEFKEDGTFHISEYNDETNIVIVGSYEIVQRKYAFLERDILIFKMPPYSSYKPPEQTIEFENDNKLKLIETCSDCYVHTYLRGLTDAIPCLVN